ncbi:unnamed protein product, partial [Onchocerca ochengi]|uniref:NTP_transf_2 domain-containing protein n=1 Tax=Onchocerca ochengi TaxID=42157 RepID=A0A182E6G7_ONCOC
MIIDTFRQSFQQAPGDINKQQQYGTVEDLKKSGAGVGFGHYSNHIESVPTTSDLDGLVIAVKTTLKFHESRICDIIDTWFQLAPNNIYFITDTPDAKLNEITGGKLIVSDCSDGHTREGLCCKMNAELELFLSQKT